MTFLHEWVSLVESVLGKLFILLCGSLLGWECCHSAIHSQLILGFVPNEPDPQPQLPHDLPAAPGWWGWSQTWMDHLQDKRITLFPGLFSLVFFLSLTTQRALALWDFCKTSAERSQGNNSRSTGHILGGCSSAPCRVLPPPDLLSHHQPVFAQRSHWEPSDVFQAGQGKQAGEVPGCPGSPGCSRQCLPFSRAT